VRLSLGPGIRRRPAFVWWVVNRLAFLVAATNLAGFMLYFLQERFADLSAERAAGPAATAALLAGILILVLALPAGWLADRLGKKPLLAASGLIGMLATATLLLLPGLGAVYLGGILLGAAVGLFYSASWALGTALIPGDEAGRYLGLSNLAGAGAGAIGAYLGGPLADTMGYNLLYTLYAGLFGLSILALLGVRE
jgi:MFS family permease